VTERAANFSRIESLVETLRAGFDFDVTALLDALWIARLIPPPEIVMPNNQSVEKSVRGAVEAQEGQTAHDIDELKSESSRKGNEPLLPLPDAVYPLSELPSAGEPFIPASAVRIPAGTALPQGLELVRALRALPTRLPSRTEVELDEEATADATAQSYGCLTPVLHPRLERWFEAALVVEHTPSMEIWTQTVVEIERILQYSGVFRDVRTYWLHAARRPYLVRQFGTTAMLGSLRDPSARRLVLLFSAGVSLNWADGTIGLAVKFLGQTNPVVLVHAMPSHLWKGTVLGEPHAMVRNVTPGGPNTELRSQRAAWARRHKLSGPRFLLPVFALEKQSAQVWADMFVSRRGRTAPAFLVRTEATSVQPMVPKRPELTAEEQVSLFKSSTSPDAFRLAVHLAAGPITMPIIHLIQTSLLGGSAQQSQIAEVMLSGLVERITPVESKLPADAVKFQFEATAKAILLKSLRRDDARRLAQLLQNYIQREFGSSNDFVISVPDPAGKLSIPASAEPFAQLRSGFLNFLGIGSLPSDFKLSPGRVAPTAQAPEKTQRLQVPTRVPPSVKPTGIAATLSGERILWVDDQPKKNSDESAYLSDELGATIDEARTTDDAISATRRVRYNLIISDMARGRETEAGLELLRRVQSEHLNVPVIIYAAQWANTGRDVASRAGAFGCTNIPQELFRLAVSAAENRRTVRGAFAGRIKIAFIGLWSDASSSDRLLEGGPDQLAREVAKRSRNIRELHSNWVAFLNFVTNCGYVQLFVVSGSEIRLAAQRSDAQKATYQTASPNGIVGLAIASRKTVYVPDVRRNARYIPAEKSTKSELAIPILNHNGDAAAVVNLESPVMDAFSEVQVRWTEEFVKAFPLELDQASTPYMISIMEDQEVTDRIARSLANAGLQISTQFSDSDCFVIALSRSALKSVAFEAAVTRTLQKWASSPEAILIIPLLIQKCDPPKSLLTFNTLDLANNFESGCRLLTARILEWSSEAIRVKPDSPGRKEDLDEGDLDEENFEDLGGLAFNKESFEEAINLYSRAIAAEPKRALLYYSRASSYWYAQLYSEAIADYTTALNLDSALESNVRASRGQVFAEMGRFQEAIRDLDLAILFTEKENRLVFSAYARRARAVAYAALGSIEDAFKEFDISRRLAPENAWLYYSVAKVLETGGRINEALEWYLIALGKTGPKLTPLNLVDAQRSVTRLLALTQPRSQDIAEADAEEKLLIEIALAALQNSKPEVAVGASSAAILKQPSNPSNYLFRSQAYRSAGLNDAAKRDLKTLMELHPSFLVEALIERGEIYIGEREFANAGRDLTRALEIAEHEQRTIDIAVIHSKFSLLHLRSGNPSAALDEISISLSLRPGSGRFLELRGQINEFDGRLGDARSDYEAAISAAEDSLNQREREELSTRIKKLGAELL
jgi:tetratricopeptide (TPR) repeat protein/putative methionine-R-sulfoxide reductase with GAF domain